MGLPSEWAVEILGGKSTVMGLPAEVAVEYWAVYEIKIHFLIYVHLLTYCE